MAKADITMLVSPSDKPLADCLGEKAVVSSIPERKGADVLIYHAGVVVGVQRKEVPHDFLISAMDGRLARETSLLATGVHYGILLGEGQFRYYRDGSVVVHVSKKLKSTVYRRFTKRAIQKIVMGVRMIKGIDVDFTEEEGIEATAAYLDVLIEFMTAKTHLSLFRRPGARGAWGTPSFDMQQSWILQGFPGVGPTLADNILKKFGGHIPAKWTCDQQELAMVDRIGVSRAKSIYEQFYSDKAP